MSTGEKEEGGNALLNVELEGLADAGEDLAHEVAAARHEFRFVLWSRARNVHLETRVRVGARRLGGFSGVSGACEHIVSCKTGTEREDVRLAAVRELPAAGAARPFVGLCLTSSLTRLWIGFWRA